MGGFQRIHSLLMIIKVYSIPKFGLLGSQNSIFHLKNKPFKTFLLIYQNMFSFTILFLGSKKWEKSNTYVSKIHQNTISTKQIFITFMRENLMFLISYQAKNRTKIHFLNKLSFMYNLYAHAVFFGTLYLLLNHLSTIAVTFVIGLSIK